jgi:hypothetical protein
VRTTGKEVGYLDAMCLAIEKDFFKFGADLLVSAKGTGLEVPLVVTSCVR